MKKVFLGTILMISIVSCAAPPKDPGPGVPASTCVAQLPLAERDQVIESWISGTLPTSVAGTEDCDFQDFAWQSFLALTATNDKGYLFTQWGNTGSLFPTEGTPPPFPGDVTADKHATGQISTKHTSSARLLDDPPLADPDADIQQAGSLVPLVDQRQRWVQYSVLANEKEYEFVRQHTLYASDCFASWGGSSVGAVKYDPAAKQVAVDCGTDAQPCPPADLFPSPLPAVPTGSEELKVSWRVLETCDLPDSPNPCTPEDTSTYITVEGLARPYSPTVEEAEVLLGLVGLHILAKTPDHKDWVWTTFEHKDTVPDCPGEPGDWIFFGENKNVNMFCTPCPIPLDSWTEEEAATARQQAADGKAVLSADGKDLLCSSAPGDFALAQPPFYNPGTEEGQCAAEPIATEVCRENPIEDSVAQLNGWVNGVLEVGAPVLSNYQLVGVLWLDSWCGANPECKEEGSTQLTNTTMETYEQSINCLVCHGKNQFNPIPYVKPYASGLADRSFLFHRIQEETLPYGTECAAPKPSYLCPNCGGSSSTGTS